MDLDMASFEKLVPRNLVADQRVFTPHHTGMGILEECFLRVCRYRINRRPDEKINISFFKPQIHTLIQTHQFKLNPGSLPCNFLHYLGQQNRSHIV